MFGSLDFCRAPRNCQNRLLGTISNRNRLVFEIVCDLPNTCTTFSSDYRDSVKRWYMSNKCLLACRSTNMEFKTPIAQALLVALLCFGSTILFLSSSGPSEAVWLACLRYKRAQARHSNWLSYVYRTIMFATFERMLPHMPEPQS